MIAKIEMSFKILGGESLKGPIARLQNATSFNFYANSTYYEKYRDTYNLGIYENSVQAQDEQEEINKIRREQLNPDDSNA